jgi:hypothetical protein
VKKIASRGSVLHSEFDGCIQELLAAEEEVVERFGGAVVQVKHGAFRWEIA